MIQLINVDIEEFKKTIYPKYVKIFPKEERKELQNIEKNYDKEITKFIKICKNNEFIEFFIINTIPTSQYIQLDYFAILPLYQNKGDGKKAMQLLKEQMKAYDGIFIEIEKPGLGKDSKENLIREKRAKFYETLAFKKLTFELKWFGTLLLAIYILPISVQKNNENEILENMFQIYYSVHGKEKVERECQVI